MTEEDIIPSRTDVLRMAREAGFEQNSLGVTYTSGALPELLERFAALVAAAEREACAKICDSVNNYDNPMTANDVADAIRARGQNDN